jgi:hypothetical protein
MRFTSKVWTLCGVGLLGTALFLQSGCYRSNGRRVEAPPPRPLGAGTDHIMMTQEINAEASKYVVYAHEFQLNHPNDVQGNTGWRLNPYGEDHVKRIAANMSRGDEFPVIVERSRTSVKPGTQFRYPVHFNEPLDKKRRQLVVAALTALGVPDADRRVVVAPALAEGYTAVEAARAYQGGLGGSASSRGSAGGAGGGFGR